MVQQFGSEDKPPLTDEEVAKAIFIGSRQARSGFIKYVELDDLIQECWADTLEKPNKYARYKNAGNYNGLIKEMVRTAGVYAQREKASALGYKPDDLFFYSRAVLREVIPAVLQSEETDELFEFEYPDRALWLDIRKALKTLTQADQQILSWAFKGDPGEEAGSGAVAKHLSISVAAATSRISRVLDKVRAEIGGPDPFYRRKATSNASAQTQTHNQWEG